MPSTRLVRLIYPPKSNNVNALILQRGTNMEAEVYIFISSSGRESSERFPIYFQLFAFWVESKIPISAPLLTEWVPWTRAQSLLCWSIRFFLSHSAVPLPWDSQDSLWWLLHQPGAQGGKTQNRIPSLSAVLFILRQSLQRTNFWLCWFFCIAFYFSCDFIPSICFGLSLYFSSFLR